MMKKNWKNKLITHKIKLIKCFKINHKIKSMMLDKNWGGRGMVYEILFLGQGWRKFEYDDYIKLSSAQIIFGEKMLKTNENIGIQQHKKRTNDHD